MDMEESIVTRRDSDLLLLIFPTEIWHIISNKFKNRPDDLEILTNSSPFFSKLLVPLKTNFLFLKVIKILSPTIWKRKEKNQRPIKEVLNWRKVSSQWNIAVDSLLWNDFKFFSSDSLNNALHFKVVNKCTKSQNSLSKFLNYFEKTHPGVEANNRSPFIGGVLILMDCDIRDQQFTGNVSTLLNRYGIYVKTVLINCFSIGFCHVQQNWLSKMPNLLTLQIVKHPTATDLEENEGQMFPKFVNLQNLDSDSLPLPLLMNLIQQNSHICSLTIRGVSKYGIEGRKQISDLDLPNLMHCKIIEKSDCDDY